MKRTLTKDIRPEYDFSVGIRGKHAKALKKNGYIIRVYQDDGTYIEKYVLGEKMVVLEADVWEYFQNSEAVNQALRAVMTHNLVAATNTP